MVNWNGTVELVRTYRFSSAHRYSRPEWSEEENQRRFGKCANPSGHGHNYRLTLRVRGVPDSETGFVVDLGELDRLVADRVLEPIDHRHLNEAVEEFAPGRRIPSSENLALWIVDRLADRLPGGATLVGVDVAEDDDLGASWSVNERSVP